MDTVTINIPTPIYKHGDKVSFVHPAGITVTGIIDQVLLQEVFGEMHKTGEIRVIDTIWAYNIVSVHAVPFYGIPEHQLQVTK